MRQPPKFISIHSPAIDELTDRGLAAIRYPCGHVDYLDVAVRRAVVTGVNQTCCKLQEDLAEMDAPKYDVDGRKLTQYEAEQEQRANEREIRKWKRKYAALEAAGQDTEEAAAKLKAAETRQKDFLQKTGLKRQYEREQMPFGNKQNPISPLANSKNNGIITSDSTMKKAVRVKRGQTIDVDKAAQGANPRYGEPGYDVNCQRCVQAYEFRRRGYDVTARPNTLSDGTIVWGSECFIKAGQNPMGVYHLNLSEGAIKRELNDAPDGARYSIYCVWRGRDAGSHVFVAEKEKGAVRFLDPQTGHLDVSHYFGLAKPGKFGFFRFDDKQITSDVSIIQATVRK